MSEQSNSEKPISSCREAEQHSHNAAMDSCLRRGDEEMPEVELRLQGVYDVVDCVFVIDILAWTLLRRLNKLGSVKTPKNISQTSEECYVSSRCKRL